MPTGAAQRLSLGLDDALATGIGRITAYWGDFENKLNLLLADLLKKTERNEPNWERMSFENRKKLLKQILASIRFEHNDVEGQDRIAKVLGKASDLQWKRNAITHGVYRVTIAPHSHMASWRAESFHNGRAVTVHLDPASLGKLWHDIAHLSGEFIEAMKLIGEVGGFSPTFPDRYLLQLFEAK